MKAWQQLKIDAEIDLVKEEMTHLSRLTVEVSNKKSEAELKILSINAEIQAIEDGKRFSSFLESKIKDAEYQQHLGLISSIREDFDQLTKYFDKDLDDSTKDLNIDRIILYIDDLDRCPPEKVVEVLQAIHLILAFPLFVVIVGVDVRWIYNSLLAKYGDMLSMEDENRLKSNDFSQEAIKGGATPFDYLEKVFQIPFRTENR